MKKKIFLIFLCAMLIFSAACVQEQSPPATVDTSPGSIIAIQPVISPEQTPEVKQSALLSSMIPAAFSPYDAPKHVTEEYPFDTLTVSFDADVTVPEATAYPVVKMQRRILTNDEFFTIVGLFADTSNGIYARWDVAKDQWKIWLDEAEQYKDENWILSDYLDNVKEYYNAAEDKVSHEPIDPVSIVQDASRQTFFVPAVDGVTAHKFQILADGFFYSANAVSVGFGSLQTITNLARDIGEYRANDETYEQYLWRIPGEPELSQEDAYAQAVELLNDMGFGELTICYAEPCSLLDNYVNKTTGWAFTFTRDVAGLNVQDEKLSGSFFISGDVPPVYTAPWDRERVLIVVAKDGIRGMSARGIANISGTEIESVQLLPFEAMQERIAEQLNQIYAQSHAGNPGKEGVVKVTSISLGVSLITDEGQTEAGYYVPSWLVNYSLKMSEGDDILGQILISAADGSYIEPRISALE